MRLLSLHLDRYGPFSGKRLNFRPDAKLHVVFGRNEAGKSSSLSAVTDLLFGVQRHTPDDFLRPGRDMRLGATIRDSRGAELTFCRRKLKPLLSDAANVALPDDALAPFLGGLSREVFRRAFGLDAEALRRSGDELKTSGGELGAALFSAASGLRGVIDIKNAMERQADGIFGERRSQSRTFYQAADRYEAARKALREHETRVEALKALREELVGQENRSETIAQRRAAIGLDRGKLDRLRRAAPILHAIDAGEAQLATLGPLPSAPEGSGVALVESVRAVENAADAMAEAQRNESRLRDEHEAIVLDRPLLDSADEVERLQTALGEYRKGQRDLPAIERDEYSAGQQLAALASRLGFSDAEMLLTRQPDDAALARVDDLVMHGRRLDQALDTRLEELRRERDALEERRRERARRAAPPDPRLLRERLTALGELRRLAEKVDEHVTAIAAEEATLAHAAARLAPKIVDLAALASVSLPSRDTIAVFTTRLSQLDEEARGERQALEAAQREATEFTNRLESLERGTPLPTLERIACARVERDRHWLALRAVVFGETGAIFGQALASEAAGFEATRSEADALADAAILDAQRVAAHAELSRECVRREAIVAERTEGLAIVEGQKQAALGDWASAWTPSGFVPLSPAEMASWLLVVTTLLDRYAKLNDRKAQERQILGQIETARPALAALIVDLGLSLVPGLPIPSELKRAESEINRISEGWDAARTSDTLMADLATRVDKAEVEAEAARESVDRWRLEFRDALPRVGLRDDAAIVEAEACLAAWREAPAIAGERERLKRRVAGIKRDAAQFTHDVDALIAAVAPDLAGPPDQALRLLGQRLTQARAAEATRDAMIRRVAEAQTAARAAIDKYDRSKRVLVGLAERLGLSSESGFAEVGGALAKRDEIVALLRQRRSELANAALQGPTLGHGQPFDRRPGATGLGRRSFVSFARHFPRPSWGQFRGPIVADLSQKIKKIARISPGLVDSR